MKAKEFNKAFEIDRNGAGVKAVEKTARPRKQKSEIFLTKDEKVFDGSKQYYFFDKQFRDVKSSKGFKQEGEFLATFGLNVCPISELRESRDSALLDAQESIKKEIKGLQNLIAKFESQKTKENRSLKTYLIAKNA